MADDFWLATVSDTDSVDPWLEDEQEPTSHIHSWEKGGGGTREGSLATLHQSERLT